VHSIEVAPHNFLVAILNELAAKLLVSSADMGCRPFSSIDGDVSRVGGHISCSDDLGDLITRSAGRHTARYGRNATNWYVTSVQANANRLTVRPGGAPEVEIG